MEAALWSDVGIVSFQNDRHEVDCMVMKMPLVVGADPMVQPERKAKQYEDPSVQIWTLWSAESLIAELEIFELVERFHESGQRGGSQTKPYLLHVLLTRVNLSAVQPPFRLDSFQLPTV